VFEDLSKKEILIIFGALFFGFAIVRLFISRNEDVRESEFSNSKNHEFEDKTQEESCFDILEIDSNASLDEIKSAYKRKISQYHPDKVSSLAPEFIEIAEKKTKELNFAYEQVMKKFN
jgi:DnaJ-domain-containing protein 1